MSKENEKPRPKGKNIRSVVLPEDVSKKLGDLAKKEERSVSFMIVRAIREMLDRTK